MPTPAPGSVLLSPRFPLCREISPLRWYHVGRLANIRRTTWLVGGGVAVAVALGFLWFPGRPEAPPPPPKTVYPPSVQVPLPPPPKDVRERLSRLRYFQY